MAKITRKQLATYINTTYGTTNVYLRLGTDLEELNTEMNNNVEKTNILGEGSVNITNGTKVTAVEPYIANVGDGLFEMLQAIIDGELELDNLITDIVEVKLWETPAGDSYPATKRPVKINIQTAGGDVQGYQIPFALHHYGTAVDGDYDIVTDAFTATA